MESDPLRRAEIMLQQADKLGCRSFISVKFTFSKKVTKIDKIFTIDLTVTHCQIDGEDFVNFCGLLRKHELYCTDFSGFVYQCLFTIVFFGKRKKKLLKPFTI